MNFHQAMASYCGVSLQPPQFDESWIYVKHFTDMNDRRNKFSEGISKDIVKQAINEIRSI